MTYRPTSNWNGHRPGSRTSGAQAALAADLPVLSPEQHRAAQDRWNRWNTEAHRRHTECPLAKATTVIGEWCKGVD